MYVCWRSGRFTTVDFCRWGASRFSSVTAPTTEDATTSTTNKPNHSRLNWSIVSPFLSKKQKTDTTTVTSIEITPQTVAWAVLDTQEHEIVNAGSTPLLREEGVICPSTLIELAYQTKQNVPNSDLFVMENKGLFKSQSSTSSVYMNLFKFQAMLSVVLNENFDLQSPVHRVFLMNSKVVSKLFHVEVGSERVSSQNIIRQMIKKSHMGYALPTDQGNLDTDDDEQLLSKKINWSSPELIRKISSGDDLWRENVSNSILTAIAFHLICVREDPETCMLLWKKKPRPKDS